MRPWSLSLLLSGLVAVVALLPVGVLLYLALGSAGPDLGGRTAGIVLDTLLLTGLTVTGAVLVGVPLAVVTTYSDLPMRGFWVALLSAPLAIPSYLGAFAFFAAFGRGGEIHALLGLPTPAVHGLAGAALVLTLYTYPFVLLGTRAALRNLDAHAVEAARTLGLSLPMALWRVALPRVRNGVAAGGLLVALYTLSDFGTPAIMQVDTFTRVIYVEYNAFGLGRAALLSLQLLFLVAIVLALETWVGVQPERPGRPLQMRLGRAARLGALTLAGLIVGGAILMPVAVYGLWLLREGAGGFPAVTVLNSIYPSLLAAAGAVVVALPVALAARRGRLGRLFERISYIGFGIPGIVMGTALVYVGLRLEPLYQTVTLLVLAYMLRFLPLSVGTVRTCAERIDDHLAGAARSLGAGPLEAFRRVNLPLILPGIVAGAALVFLEAMRELPATLLLAPSGFETLATYLWRVYEAGYFGRGAIPGLLLVLASGLAVLVMLVAEGGGPARRMQENTR